MLTDGNTFHVASFILAIAGSICFVIYAFLLLTAIGAGLARHLRGEPFNDESVFVDGPREAMMQCFAIIAIIAIVLSTACLLGPPVFLWLVACFKALALTLA